MYTTCTAAKHDGLQASMGNCYLLRCLLLGEGSCSSPMWQQPNLVCTEHARYSRDCWCGCSIYSRSGVSMPAIKATLPAARDQPAGSYLKSSKSPLHFRDNTVVHGRLMKWFLDLFHMPGPVESAWLLSALQGACGCSCLASYPSRSMLQPLAANICCTVHTHCVSTF